MVRRSEYNTVLRKLKTLIRFLSSFRLKKSLKAPNKNLLIRKNKVFIGNKNLLIRKNKVLIGNKNLLIRKNKVLIDNKNLLIAKKNGFTRKKFFSVRYGVENNDPIIKSKELPEWAKYKDTL